MTLQNKLETLKVELKNKIDEMTSIKDAIAKEVEKFEYIDKVSVSFQSWRRKGISIYIKNVDAWSDTMTLEIYEDKHTFSTSSGGWNTEERALEIMHSITGDLIEYVKNFDTSILEKLQELEEKIAELRLEIEEVEIKIKENEILKDYRKVTDLEIEGLIEKAKNEDYSIYKLFRGRIEGYAVSYYNRRFRVDGKAISKNDLREFLKDAYLAK